MKLKKRVSTNMHLTNIDETDEMDEKKKKRNNRTKNER